MTFEELEAESVKRYAFQIMEQMRGRGALKPVVARDVVSLLESALGYCGDELAAEFARRMLRWRRLAHGFCPTCGKERITHPPLLCAACDERDLS